MQGVIMNKQLTLLDFSDSDDEMIKKLATENKELYGSVKPTEIAKILNEIEKIEINPSLIQPVKEIKSIGTFKVVLSLHPEVLSEISIKVISEDNK